ncbi:MAG: hypothetical protein U5K43_12050 [Halofilum sp. (in: g-proteobacteria)]|nr:hypothetical protein [Halofilum sp. (in: g-proteobacteria)]
MLYALLLLIALALVTYFGGRWLLGELREASGALGARLKVLTGGLTGDHLLARTRAALAGRGLAADCIVLSSRITPVYDALRRQVIGRTRGAGPAGRAGAGARRSTSTGRTLYLRAVETPPGAAGRERRRRSTRFDEVVALRRVASAFPARAVAAGARGARARGRRCADGALPAGARARLGRDPGRPGRARARHDRARASGRPVPPWWSAERPATAVRR